MLTLVHIGAAFYWLFGNIPAPASGDVAGRGRGVTLLTLNTRAGDPPEALYLRLGYTLVGPIPAFAQNPDGSLNTTSIMYKLLGGERA